MHLAMGMTESGRYFQYFIENKLPLHKKNLPLLFWPECLPFLANLKQKNIFTIHHVHFNQNVLKPDQSKMATPRSFSLTVHGARWCRTDDQGVLGSNPAGGTSLRNFGNSVYPHFASVFRRRHFIIVPYCPVLTAAVAEWLRAWDTLTMFEAYGVREVVSSIPDRGNIVG